MVDRDPRDKQIDALLNLDMDRFESWRSESGAFQTLAIPPELADVFIPRRLRELSHEPSSVRAIVLSSRPNELGFMLVEAFDEPISDPEIYVRWQEDHPERHGKVVNLNALVATTPEGVDYQHVFNHSKVENGLISLNEKVILTYFANLQRVDATEPHYPYLVETRNLYDREEMQGLGIGTSFYQRLEEVFRRLGFRYLAGHIISPHPGFFAKTRRYYKDLPDEIRAELPDEYATNTMGDIMIKVL